MNVVQIWSRNTLNLRGGEIHFGPMVVLGGWTFFLSEVPLYLFREIRRDQESLLGKELFARHEVRK